MPNHLITESSPYLQQHADNPVDWYPWCEEAINKAKLENKPILLSIGYSACHWCHVMARESFANPHIAALMNQWFINIKVDKEERPDLDKVYQLAYQLLMQQPGGWPLTAFLTPQDHIPYLIGTYFPAESRPRIASFKQVLQYAHEVFTYQQANINEQNNSMLAVFKQLSTQKPVAEINLAAAPTKVALKILGLAFDKVNGGFGDAPKFVNPTQLELLLQIAKKGDAQAAHIFEFTLSKIAAGGIYDHLAGGFFRYSVDAEWMIPHFEKMLYDNAQLIYLYAKAYEFNKNSLFKIIACETAEWVMHEMQSPTGGYYSTLNAESEGEEGKYYVWKKDEIEQLINSNHDYALTPAEYQILIVHFGLDETPNFENKAWHLYVKKPLNDNQQAIFTNIKKKLLSVRKKRISPSCDEKILTSWNGLMIRGMVTAGKLLSQPKFIISAEKALNFIRSHLWLDNHLYASYKNGKARFNGYLTDYVFLIDAILALLAYRDSKEDLKFACQLADIVLQSFQDCENGGFYFTANNHEPLIYRPKNLQDEAIPADNGIAVKVLLELSKITGIDKYKLAAEKALRYAWKNIEHDPDAHCALLLAIESANYAIR